MKTKILLCLVLCAVLFGCKDEDPVVPGELQVFMSSSGQTLVEGGEALEVAIELDREFGKPYTLYLDYGDGYGEYSNFFDQQLQRQGIRVNTDGGSISVLAITFLAGERKKVIKLEAEENRWYRGDRPVELKLLSLTDLIDKKPVYHASLKIGYQDNEPKPIFGILRNWEADTVYVGEKRQGGAFKLTLVASIPFQFPQKIGLKYTGTAEQFKHFQGKDYILFDGSTSEYSPHNHPVILSVLASGDFSPSKSIRVQLDSAEDGEIADETTLLSRSGYPYTLGNHYTLVLSEN